jgi:LemA protein
MQLGLILVIVIPLVILFFVWMTYNALVTLRLRVKEAWADIDVQLKKRYDLLPDLVATAQKAVAVDEDILTKVTELRSRAMEDAAKGVNPEERAKVENQLSGAIRDIKVQVEAYPDIKSHQELLSLMEKTTDIEEKISYSRRFYNSNVLAYNTKSSMFPAVLIAGMLGFKQEEFFAANEEERQDVKVDFNNNK